MEDTVANQKEIIEGYISAYNALDVERMLSFVHQNVEFMNISGNEVNATANGIEELRQMAEQTKSMFSMRHQSIKYFETAGDTVTVGIKFEAVLSVNLPNGVKTGDALKLMGRSVFQFKDGKLYRITDYS